MSHRVSRIPIETGRTPIKTGRTSIGMRRMQIEIDPTHIGMHRMQIRVEGFPNLMILVSTGTGNIPGKAHRILSETEGLPIKTVIVSIKKLFYTPLKAVK